MEGRARAHAAFPEDGAKFDEGVNVVGGVEEGEAAGEEGEEDDARGPDVDLGGLGGAFEEDLRGAEAAGSRAIGAAGGAGVVFREADGGLVAGGEGFGLLECADREGVEVAQAAVGGGFGAEAALAVGVVGLGEAEVDEDALLARVVVEEVGGFDVAVEDAGFVDAVEGGEEAVEVVSHVADEEVAVVEAEVEMAVVGEDGDDLVEVAECC